MSVRLCDRHPTLDPASLVAALRPPERFAQVSFDSYRPDPAQPTQAEAVRVLRALADPPRPSRLRRAPTLPGGVYLDGGFGVGKTHLLASLWHAVPPPKAYGTFVQFTSAVGALGFAATVDALAGMRIVCIDEFELDDPGDTVLVASLLTRLAGHGVRLAATSNTQPEDLGEGRFAASDFRREIAGLADRFATVRIDGPDYRARGLPRAPTPATPARCAVVAARDDVAVDSFDELLTHLRTLHPSRYAPLVADLRGVVWPDVVGVTEHGDALRLVALVDRLYDVVVPVVAGGVALDRIFSEEMLRGGYRKKYSRTISRLVALAAEGERL